MVLEALEKGRGTWVLALVFVRLDPFFLPILE